MGTVPEMVNLESFVANNSAEYFRLTYKSAHKLTSPWINHDNINVTRLHWGVSVAGSTKAQPVVLWVRTITTPTALRTLEQHAPVQWSCPGAMQSQSTWRPQHPLRIRRIKFTRVAHASMGQSVASRMLSLDWQRLALPYGPSHSGKPSGDTDRWPSWRNRLW